jgi:hypothetical protein
MEAKLREHESLSESFFGRRYYVIGQFRNKSFDPFVFWFCMKSEKALPALSSWSIIEKVEDDISFIS